MSQTAARKDYQRGWTASRRQGRSLSTGPSALERADMRGESAAWYLGYEDYALDRPKWHALQQPEHNA